MSIVKACAFLSALLLPACLIMAQSTRAAAADPELALRALLPRLASDDFAQREAAQKELDALDYHVLPALRKGAAGVTDAEVKARLQERLEKLEDQVATAPPPISLKLTDASFGTMVAAFSKSAGCEFEGGSGETKTFTLDVQDKPFWEVYRLLAQQDALAVSGYMGTFRLSHDEGEPLRNFTISGPFALAPRKLSRTMTSDFQKTDGAPSTAKLEFTVAVDPRVQVVRHENVQFTSIVDEEGHSLLPLPEKFPLSFYPSAGGDFTWSQNATLNIPANAGKKIASAKGSFRVDVAVATTEMTLDDPGERLNKEFTCQDRKITITKWEAMEDNPGYIKFEYKVARENEKNMTAAKAMNLPPEAVFFYQIDATGKVVGKFNSILQGNSSLWISGKAPIKLRILVPTRTKQIEVPFEFKGLSIPGVN